MDVTSGNIKLSSVDKQKVPVLRKTDLIKSRLQSGGECAGNSLDYIIHCYYSLTLQIIVSKIDLKNPCKTFLGCP